MIDLREIASPIFGLLMAALMPARKRGKFGTPDEPIYFDAGDTIPWWVECRWPLHTSATFLSDVETYYEDGWQVVRVLEEGESCMAIDGKGCDTLIFGAPTLIDGRPRKRKRARLKVLEYSPATGG